MRYLMIGIMAVVLGGCVFDGDDKKAGPFDGTYYSSEGHLKLFIDGNQFEIQAFALNDGAKKEIGSDFSYRITGPASLHIPLSLTPDTIAKLTPRDFFRRNGDDTFTKLESLTYNGQSFSDGEIFFYPPKDGKSGRFTNYLQGISVARED